MMSAAATDALRQCSCSVSAMAVQQSKLHAISIAIVYVAFSRSNIGRTGKQDCKAATSRLVKVAYRIFEVKHGVNDLLVSLP